MICAEKGDFNMNITPGKKKINYGHTTSIMDINAGQFDLYVFQGTMANASPYDIKIMYKDPNAVRIRTPKHIHWAVDLLLKKEHDPTLTNAFLAQLQNDWLSTVALTANNYQALNTLIINKCNNANLNKYLQLDNYGEYPIEFLYPLLILLAAQEVTNAQHRGQTASLFGKVISELQKNNLDIFAVLSAAGFGGR